MISITLYLDAATEARKRAEAARPGIKIGKVKLMREKSNA